MAELNFAVDEGKEVFPAVYKECKRPFRIRSAQYADFTEDYELGLSALVKALIVERAHDATTEPSRPVPAPEPARQTSKSVPTAIETIAELTEKDPKRTTVAEVAIGQGRRRLWYWAAAAVFVVVGILVVTIKGRPEASPQAPTSVPVATNSPAETITNPPTSRVERPSNPARKATPPRDAVDHTAEAIAPEPSGIAGRWTMVWDNRTQNALSLTLSGANVSGTYINDAGVSCSTSGSFDPAKSELSLHIGCPALSWDFRGLASPDGSMIVGTYNAGRSPAVLRR